MKRLLLLILIITSFQVQAQLTNWQYKTTYRISDTQDRTDFQVLFVVNTDSLINLGQLNADASDLRFATDCDGTTLLDYYLEDTVSTQANIWVKTNLTANTPQTVFMFYGNTIATSVSDFVSVFPNAYIVDADVIIDIGIDTLKSDWIEIKPGINLTLNPLHEGVLIFKARNIIIDGILQGDGLGYDGGAVDDGEGPGKGYGNDLSGVGGYGTASGAGHGGRGGAGDTTSATYDPIDPIGQAYDFNNLLSIDAGSGGGVGGYFAPSTVGGNGGAAFGFIGKKVAINGDVSVKGLAPTGYGFFGAGGGSGGGIMTIADIVQLNGNLDIGGGAGGSPEAGGGIGITAGGGSGGRIKLFYSSQLINNANVFLMGGTSHSGGIDPDQGTLFDSLIVSNEPIVDLLTIPNQLSLIADGGSTTICEQDSLGVLTDFGFASYDYYVNQVLVLTDTLNSATFIGLTDSDTIRVETSFSGCMISSNNLVVTVNPKAIASFNYLLDVDQATFNNTSLNGDSFLWDFGNGNTSIAVSPMFQYADTGTYDVCLYATNNCGTDSICETITIICPPIETKFTFEINNLSVTFLDSTSEAVSWSWDFGNGDTSVVENPVYTYVDSTANYTVCLTAKNNCGEEQLFCQEVMIVSTTGMNEVGGSQVFSLFPNPSASFIVLKWNGNAQAHLIIYNAFGQLVKSELITNDTKVNVNDLPQGMYYVQLLSDNKLLGIKSLMVE